MNARTIICGLAASLMAGCGPEKADDFTPIENGSGFGYIARASGCVHKSLTVGLFYQGIDGKRTRVWRNLRLLWGDNIQVTNNLAVCELDTPTNSTLGAKEKLTLKWLLGYER